MTYQIAGTTCFKPKALFKIRGCFLHSSEATSCCTPKIFAKAKTHRTILDYI